MKEIWMPSPHYSTSRGPYNKLVLHTTEGALTVEALGDWFANPSAGVSSHFGADNVKRGTVGAYVYESNNAWTQGNANPYCVSIELCTPVGAAANWSRSYWLNSQDTLLRNSADWVAWMAGKYGIPIRELTPSQAQDPNYRGVCQHRDLGAWGGGHYDCGNGFPMDKIIEWAKGGTQDGAPVMTTSSVAFDSQGGAHLACIWSDGKVNYRAPGGTWYAVDDGSNAKDGCGIAISSDDLVMITYVNQGSEVCTYQKPVSGGKWQWASRGGSVKLGLIMTKDFGTFLVGIVYLAILFVLVRPGSLGPQLVNNVSDGLSGLIKAGTGGGTWSGK